MSMIDVELLDESDVTSHSPDKREATISANASFRTINKDRLHETLRIARKEFDGTGRLSENIWQELSEFLGAKKGLPELSYHHKIFSNLSTAARVKTGTKAVIKIVALKK